MNLQLAFWDPEPRLHLDLHESLKVFYYRIPVVSAASYPMLVNEDMEKLLARAAAIGELDWLAVFKFGSVFAAQDVIVERLREEIASLPADRVLTGQGDGPWIVNLKALRSSSGGWGGDKTFASLASSAPPLSARVLNEVAIPEEAELNALNRNLGAFYKMEDMSEAGTRKVLGWLFNRKFGFDVKHEGGAVNLLDAEYKVFLFNTEDLVPDRDWVRANGKPLDIYLGPCSGFFDAATLFTHGFTDKTRTVHYDFNPRSLEIKRKFHEEFSGDLEELLPFCRSLFPLYPETPFFFSDPAGQVKKILDLFGSKDAFRETWTALRRLPREYVRLNLIAGFRDLIFRVGHEEQAAFLISDIFTGQNELTYGFTVINQKFREFLKEASVRPNLIVSGKDTKGHPILGPAAQIALQYF